MILSDNRAILHAVRLLVLLPAIFKGNSPHGIAALSFRKLSMKCMEAQQADQIKLDQQDTASHRFASAFVNFQMKDKLSSGGSMLSHHEESTSTS